jgi:hypothetical protein
MMQNGITMLDRDNVKKRCDFEKENNYETEVQITIPQCRTCRQYNMTGWMSNPSAVPATVSDRSHIRVDTGMLEPRRMDVPHSAHSALTPWPTSANDNHVQHSLATTPQHATPITPTHIQRTGPNLTMYPSGVDRLRRSGIQTLSSDRATQISHGSGIRNEDIGAFPIPIIPVQGDNQQHAPAVRNWWNIRSRRR